MSGTRIVGALLVLASSAAIARAQAPIVVSGQVVRVTTSGPAPVPGANVILHRIGASSAGPLDSTIADGTGHYRFRIAAPDTNSMYLPTTRHGGLAYFAAPIRVGGPTGEGAIEVFDTTSAAVPIRTTGRHFVVSAPDADGHRAIVEVYEVSNDTTLTRIGSRDRPAFVAILPRGATNVRATQGDFTGDAVVTVPGGVGVVAPVAPGIRQLALNYVLPPSAFPLDITLSDSSAVVEVLLEEPSGRATGDSLEALGAVTSDGRSFVRFLGRDLPVGRRIQVLVPPAAGGSVARWGWLAVLSLAALGAIGWSMGRRPAAVVAPVSAPAPPPVLSREREVRAAIGGVDAMLEDAATPAASHGALRAYRDQLQSELDATLASPADHT